HTLADSLVLDRFYVHDNDYTDQPPPERFECVSAVLVDALTNPSDEPPSFRRLWQGRDVGCTAQMGLLPTRVVVDNTTSRQYTILDVFAHDRIGLLYAISRTLFDLGVSVRIAKIGTYLDQVVDVFYVTDQQGDRIDDEDFLIQIRNRLLEAIKESESDQGIQQWNSKR
ncbi:MAG: hypothetical protein ACE1ZA_14555, partial [Pseudomonadales bacterium]